MHHNYEVDIQANYDGTYDVICIECGEEFQATRFDAAFCSSTCRSRNHRAKQRIDQDIARTIEYVKNHYGQAAMERTVEIIKILGITRVS